MVLKPKESQTSLTLDYQALSTEGGRSSDLTLVK